MNIEEYKNNPKTAFLASLYEKLNKEENEARQMVEKDPTMKELVEGEITFFAEQKKNLEEQMSGIVAEEKKEEEADDLKINEVVLEVRAGAGRSVRSSGISRRCRTRDIGVIAATCWWTSSRLR